MEFLNSIITDKTQYEAGFILNIFIQNQYTKVLGVIDLTMKTMIKDGFVSKELTKYIYHLQKIDDVPTILIKTNFGCHKETVELLKKNPIIRKVKKYKNRTDIYIAPNIVLDLELSYVLSKVKEEAASLNGKESVSFNFAFFEETVKTLKQMSYDVEEKKRNYDKRLFSNRISYNYIMGKCFWQRQ